VAWRHSQAALDGRYWVRGPFDLWMRDGSEGRPVDLWPGAPEVQGLAAAAEALTVQFWLGVEPVREEPGPGMGGFPREGARPLSYS